MRRRTPGLAVLVLAPLAWGIAGAALAASGAGGGGGAASATARADATSKGAGPDAAEAPALRRWIDGVGATGDWGGARPWLDAHGVDVFAQYTTGFWSNTRGGFETGTRYEGFATWGFGLDLHRLVRWPGASFRMNWNSYHGGQPSIELVGVYPTQALSGWEAATGVRFFEIALRQMLWRDRIRLEIGQLTSDGEFFQSQGSALFLNATFGFLGFERQLTPFYPVAAPGVFAGLRTRDARWELRTAAYTAAAGQDVTDNIGFDWGFGDGFTLFAEALARPRVAGRQAELSFGFVGVRSTLQEFGTDETVGSTFSIYAIVDVPIVEPRGLRPGLRAFVRTFGTPSTGRIATDWYASGGLVLDRPFPGRDADAFGVAFTVQGFGDAYLESQAAAGNDVSPRESIVEVTYRAQVLGWLAVQPDLQVVVDPHFSRRNAVAVGLRGVIDL